MHGPKFRAAEAEITRLKEGHAREMRQLRQYVETLRAYGERLRRELDEAKAKDKQGGGEAAAAALDGAKPFPPL